MYKNTPYQISAPKSQYLYYNKYLNMKASLNKFKRSQESEIRRYVKAYDRTYYVDTLLFYSAVIFGSFALRISHNSAVPLRLEDEYVRTRL